MCYEKMTKLSHEKELCLASLGSESAELTLSAIRIPNSEQYGTNMRR
jgi:hypothetical protein